MSGLDLSYGSPNFTVRDVTRNLRNLPVTAEIRTRWQYCNMMYMTISHFIQTWTGIGLGDFFRTRFYEPLGMNRTFFSLKDARAAAATGEADIATPYFWNNYTQDYESFALLDASQGDVPYVPNHCILSTPIHLPHHPQRITIVNSSPLALKDSNLKTNVLTHTPSLDPGPAPQSPTSLTTQNGFAAT